MNQETFDEVNEPFIPKSNDLESAAGEGSGNSKSSSPYHVEYKGSEIFIDSVNWRHSTLLKFQILLSFAAFVLFGLVDQAIGTLIPIFQREYKVGDAQTGFLFLSSITGYILMGLMNGIFHNLLGLRGFLVMGFMAMTITYTIFSFAPPFWVLVMFAIGSGTGCGILDAACNAWISKLVDSNQILGILHGCYGLGCMIAPSLITSLVEREVNPWKWNYYYRLLATLAFSVCCLNAFVFRFETTAKYKYQNALKSGRINKEGIELTNLNSSDEEPDFVAYHEATLTDALKSKLVWTFSMILFFCVGGEAAFGSWIVSFLLRINHLPYKTSSHMATTFWAGVMLGRTCLGFVTAHFFSTELMANMCYIGGSVLGYFMFYMISYTSLYWLFFIVVFITGLFAGPIFPTTIVSTIGILPHELHTSGVGFICAFGGGGAAAVPFLIGILAESSATGLRIFPLVLAVVHVLLFISWSLITRNFLPTYKRPQGN